MATESRPVAGVTIKERNVAEQKGAPVLTSSARSRPVSPAAVEADTVQVWPHLVVIEFLAAVVFTINLVLLGTLINGPLDKLANADKTPNPSKAPWYFLNLQELLLHMNPALAGVIVPTIALVALAAIPYIDKGTRGLGVWFYNERGVPISAFAAVFTTVVLAALIYVDQPTVIPLKDTILTALKEGGLLHFLTTIGLFGDEPTTRGILVELLAGITIPVVIMLFFMVLLVIVMRRMFAGLTTSELIIGLFSAFVATYVVLTFVGTAMRGPGMLLYPPWAVPKIEDPVGLLIQHLLGAA